MASAFGDEMKEEAAPAAPAAAPATSATPGESKNNNNNEIQYFPSAQEVWGADPSAGLLFKIDGHTVLLLPQTIGDKEGDRVPAEVPVYTILVIDRSGSMGQQMTPLLGGLSRALKEFKQLQVIAFDDRVEGYNDIEPSVLPWIGLHARGCTSMAPTVPEVEKLLRRISPGREVLLIVASDGVIDDSTLLKARLESMEQALSARRTGRTTVIGLRVGHYSHRADTVAISGYVTGAKATSSDLHTIPEVTIGNIEGAVASSLSKLQVSPTSSNHTLSSERGIARTPFDKFELRHGVVAGQLVFLGGDSESEALLLNKTRLRVVEITLPRGRVIDAVAGMFETTKFGMVSGILAADEAVRRLRALQRMIPADEDADAWRAMTACEVAEAAAKKKKATTTGKSLSLEIATAINEAHMIATRSQQEQADFIVGMQAAKFVKRAKEAGVGTLVQCLLCAFEYLAAVQSRVDLEEAPPCYLTLQSTCDSLWEAAKLVRDGGYNPQSVLDILDLVGVVGFAVSITPVRVVADAWGLWGVVGKVFAGECEISTSALAQALRGGHAIEYPAFKGSRVTGVIPVAHNEHELEVLKILGPLRATHASLCCFETPLTLPHMDTALLGDAILAYIKQLGGIDKFVLEDYSEKERATLHALCYTFNGLHRGDAFKAHCRDAEQMLSGDEKHHPNQTPFSVTRMRVLASVVAAKVLGLSDMGDLDWVTYKLYDILWYRAVKRAAGHNLLDRTAVLRELLLTDWGKLVAGPLGHVLHPFVEGPEEVTVDMLDPMPEDGDAAYRVVVAAACEALHKEHDGFLHAINRVRDLVGLPSLRPDVDTIVVALACKNEASRPHTKQARKLLGPKVQLQLEQARLQRFLDKKQKQEEFLRHANLRDALLAAPNLDTFRDLLGGGGSGGGSGGESKVGDHLPDKGIPNRLCVVQDVSGNPTNVFNALIVALSEQRARGEGPTDATGKPLVDGKLVYAITGRQLCDFDGEDVDELPDKCFGGTPSMAHYDTHLQPCLTPKQFHCAKCFMVEGFYTAGRGSNRHGHSNEKSDESPGKSFYMLTGGAPPGPDFTARCKANGLAKYSDEAKGFPTKDACQSLKQFKYLVGPARFGVYLLDHLPFGGSGLEHPTFNSGGRVGRAFLERGALYNEHKVIQMLEDVLVHKTMTRDTFLQQMALWVY